MTLAKSEPNQADKIDNKLPKLTTTQQPPVSEEEMRQAVRTLPDCLTQVSKSTDIP